MRKFPPKTRKWCFSAALLLAFCVVGTTPGMAFQKVSKSFFTGIAIRGFDTVAYHTEGRAMKGKRDFSYKWNDATWHFASAENRNLFVSDPERYAPQFGGY